MSDDNIQMEIVAAVYPNLYDAQATLNDLVKLHNSGAIELIDAAVMVRERSGNLTITERAELTPAKGAKRGALIGAVLGVVFPPSLLASAALGAAAGAVALHRGRSKAEPYIPFPLKGERLVFSLSPSQGGEASLFFLSPFQGERPGEGVTIAPLYPHPNPLPRGRGSNRLATPL